MFTLPAIGWDLEFCGGKGHFLSVLMKYLKLCSDLARFLQTDRGGLRGRKSKGTFSESNYNFSDLCQEVPAPVPERIQTHI